MLLRGIHSIRPVDQLYYQLFRSSFIAPCGDSLLVFYLHQCILTITTTMLVNSVNFLEEKKHVILLLKGYSFIYHKL